MQEEADPQVGAQLAEHRRHQLELVVLHPDRGALGRDVRRGLREPGVDQAVRLPPAALVGGCLDGVVVERPDRRVGLALVVALQLLGAQRHRVQPDSLQIERFGRGAGAAGPADPGAVMLGEDGVQRGDQPARAASPLPSLGCAHLVDRQAVRHYDKGATDGHDRPPPGADGSTAMSVLSVAAVSDPPCRSHVPVPDWPKRRRDHGDRCPARGLRHPATPPPRRSGRGDVGARPRTCQD